MEHPALEALAVDSLQKVFADERPAELDCRTPVVGFAGERTAVQVAVHVPRTEAWQPPVVDVALAVTAPPGVRVRPLAVQDVPVLTPASPGIDGDEYLRTDPGLYPDLLRPMAGGELLTVRPGTWCGLWLRLDLDGEVTDGPQELRIALSTPDAPGGDVALTVPLHLSRRRLPELDIVNTHWLHVDGLLDQYGTELGSEEFWGILERFLRAAADASITSVLTPVWTPPLDTAVGATRRPTQLVRIREEAPGQYAFDLADLRRWLEVARAAGLRQLEMPHLFTQWGARATPAIYAERTDAAGQVRTERIFGWDVPATDPRYRRFLEQLLPPLLAVLEEHWGLDRVIFHVSDEPGPDDLESYRAARAVVADLLAGVRILDALSDLDYARERLVDVPIVATNHAEPFLAAGMGPRWVYYCVSQNRGVANRFIAQASWVNRALGAQLFLNRAEGFLHWGLTFYNAQYSRRSVNPFLDTCAGGGFPGGDAFLLYPGAGGEPLASLRSEVFAEAMLDHRVGQLLRETLGEDRARQIMGEGLAPGYGLGSLRGEDMRRRLHRAVLALAGADASTGRWKDGEA